MMRGEATARSPRRMTPKGGLRDPKIVGFSGIVVLAAARSCMIRVGGDRQRRDDDMARSAAARHLHRLFVAGAVGGLTDGQLLERFVARRGEAAEAAFEALVERHGPMVLGVCRRI